MKHVTCRGEKTLINSIRFVVGHSLLIFPLFFFISETNFFFVLLFSNSYCSSPIVEGRREEERGLFGEIILFVIFPNQKRHRHKILLWKYFVSFFCFCCWFTNVHALRKNSSWYTFMYACHHYSPYYSLTHTTVWSNWNLLLHNWKLNQLDIFHLKQQLWYVNAFF